MKHCISSIILLLSISAYSQSSFKAQSNNLASIYQYMWSFSKNKVTLNEKALIDFNVMDNWRQIGNYLSVSNDGKYIAYTINKPNPLFRISWNLLSKMDSLVVQSTNTSWRRVFSISQQGFFSADGKQYIFQNGTSLAFLQLGTNQLKQVEDVSSFKLNEEKNWLAYQLKDKDSLVLQSLATGKEISFEGIKDYDFNNTGEWLVYKNNEKELVLHSMANGIEKKFSSVVNYAFSGNGQSLVVKSNTSLLFVNLLQGEAKSIWTLKEKTSFGNYSIDASGKQLVFTIADSADAGNIAMWYYKVGMDRAFMKINNETRGIPTGTTISNPSFTDNASYIKFTLQPKPGEACKINADMAGLEVWNHKDLYLQSVQAKQIGKSASYNAIATVDNGKLVLLESIDKKLDQIHGDFALVRKDYQKLAGDRFWEAGGNVKEDSTWLISLKVGISKLLPTQAGRENFWFSPKGNYLVYFDANKGCHYYSYGLNHGVVKDVSADVPKGQLGIIDRLVDNDQNPKSGNLAAWVENDAAVLVYDNYDIWKLDLTGKQPAVNITNGFGQLKTTIFNLFTTDRKSYEIPIVRANESLVLRGYNTDNKQSGFYKKDGLDISTPIQLYMGSYFMNAIGGCHDPNLSNEGMAPMKEKNGNNWIVQRQATNDAPNYYETTDFKNFRRLTNYQPQKHYQWLTEELHSFKHLDGKVGRGILYKPENFDPTKKYPVLIVFYGAFSDNLNQFHVPIGNFDAISPGCSPIWFLNNGYLVFTPDISVSPTRFGQKAFSDIEGAAQYLKTLPYVDGDKLGCASHSWSAKLGAYLFTHSTLISATAISEGFLYGNVLNMAFSPYEGESRLKDTEVEMQYGEFWNNKEAWLDQTTVLNVDKAKSPLLLFCNKKSTEDYQDQTFQFFTALRRLDKPVWWLKYDKGSHNLSDLKELKDYTIRYTQFFDHYLKNAPASIWMTEGVPNQLKGIESRYDLDPKGKCNAPNGEPCLICEAWNKQYARTPGMFKKELRDWALDKDIADELEWQQNEKRKELDKQGEVQTKEVMRILNGK